jgi:hypothetical protein
VVGEECPIANNNIFFSEVILFYCAMSFNGEDTRLKVNCTNKFKEYDERI